MPTTQDYTHKVSSIQEGLDWQQGVQSVIEVAKSGELPDNFQVGAELCQQAFGGLSQREQEALKEISPDTRTAIFMLAANMWQESKGSNHRAAAVDHLLHEVISQTTHQPA